MPCSLFRACRHPSALLLALTLLALPNTVLTQTREEADSAAVEEPAEPARGKDKGLSIRIDESGIRIEGAVDEDDTLGAVDRTVVDSSEPRQYTERATNIAKFGEDVFVGPHDLVRGDVVVFGADATIEGKIVGNVVVIGGNADVRSGAEINGDVVVLGGELHEESEVLIYGERYQFKDISISLGGLSHYLGPNYRVVGLFFIPVQFFISIIMSFIIVLFMRDRVVNGHEHVVTGFLKSFGAGFLVLFVGTFVVTVLFGILLITLIGIPLAFVLLVSCVAVFIIARTVFVYALGFKVNEVLKLQTTSPFAIVLVGTAVLYLPALIGYGVSLWPIGSPLGVFFKGLGMVISLFGYLVGLGALFLSRFGSRGAPVAMGVPAPPPDPSAPAPTAAA